MVLWGREDYRKEALRQLTDRTTYEPLTSERVYQIKIALKAMKFNFLRKLLQLGHVSSQELRLIRRSYPTFPPIYFLPKIHKNKRPDTNTFAGRPIIAATDGPFKLIDHWLATLTAPLLQHIPGSLKDTTHLINVLEALPSSPNAILFSADVENLYPSIPWEEGFNAATAFYSRGLNFLKRRARRDNQLPPPTPELFREALELVLKYNVFHFQNTLWFRQISGTAMGCSISVFFANTFMYYRTKTIIRNPPTGLIACFRYIDDIIGEYEGDPENIPNIFTDTVDEHIKLTYVIGGKNLEALDLKIHLDDEGKLTTSLFRKPTDNHQFVHWASHHPPHLKRSLPYSQLLRIRRNCSHIKDFENEATALITRFRARKYPAKLLLDARDRVRKLDRNKLLSNERGQRPKEDRMTFVTTYQREWSKLFRNTISTHYPTLRNHWQGTNNPLPTELPRTAFRTHPKLGSTLGTAYKHGK